MTAEHFFGPASNSRFRHAFRTRMSQKEDIMSSFVLSVQFMATSVYVYVYVYSHLTLKTINPITLV